MFGPASSASRTALVSAGVLLTAACAGGGTGSAARPSEATTSAPAPTAAPIRNAVPAVRTRWPLTGLPAGTRASDPALSIKVDNAPQARPQSGLNEADLVFEVLVEGGLSRFMAVYQSHSAQLVGPIRSARPVDGALLRALNGGLFAYSGAADGEIAPVKAYSHAFLLSRDAQPAPFIKLRSRWAPQNVYANTQVLRDNAMSQGANEPAPPMLFTYGTPPPRSARVADIQVTIGSAATASWTRSGGEYLRSENGTPHLLADGSRVAATNVVILRVDVVGSGIRDAAGNEDPFVRAYGSGEAMVFCNGVIERGHWSRPTVTSRLAFTSSAGGPMLLQPGRTWVELVPKAGSVEVH
jgi:hypothetical protein